MTPTPSHAPLTPPQARVIGAAFGATLRCTTSGNFKTPNLQPPTPNPKRHTASLSPAAVSAAARRAQQEAASRREVEEEARRGV